MSGDRKHAFAEFWATVVVVLVAIVGYPLCLGPAIWLRDRELISGRQFDALCEPAVSLTQILPEGVGRRCYDALDWYVILWE